jgi:hypothetical protein
MIKNIKNFEDSSKKEKIECICDYCGNDFKRTKHNIERSYINSNKDSCANKECVQKKRIEVFNLKYGCDNPFQSKEIKQKIINKNIEKYGVSNPSQNEDIKKKQQDTCFNKYGVENPFQSEEIKYKIEKQNLELYGVKNSFQRKEIQEKQKITIKKKYKTDHYSKTSDYKKKIIETNLNRYGVEQTFMSPEIQEKIKQTNIERYGVENPLANKEIQEKIKKTCIELFGVENPMSNPIIFNKMIETCINEYGKFPVHKYGKTQNEIKDWLNSFGFNFSSNHTVLDGKELDMLDDKLKIAIEYCGLHWHNECSPEPRNHNYHLSKHIKCLEKDIQLLTIFEDEWKLRQNQCKSHIKSILGVSSKKIFARKCEIKEISKSDAKNFFNSYHIQGSNKLGVIFYGLFFEDALCAAMSLGRHSRQIDASKKEITLDRLCFKDGIQIVGGASKLFSRCSEWAENNGYKKIISFSDNRWSLGKVYERMGFLLEKEYKPDYSYIEVNNARKRISKQSQKKNITNCPQELTEHSWALQRGLARIYDCGKKRWAFELS